jgi:thioredoxin-like negative regulator of GroEL
VPYVALAQAEVAATYQRAAPLAARRKESVQVRAAVTILEHAARAIELMDLEERVAGLEERLLGREQTGRRAG